MKKAVYFLGIILLFGSLYSCSSKESLVQSPSFVAANNLPEKPSYEDNDAFADYYSEDYTSLTPANMTRITEDDVTRNSNFNVNQYLSPTLTFGISFGNSYGRGFGCNPFNNYNRYSAFYDPFNDPFGYYGFGYNSLYTNYLCGCSPSYWYGSTYYSQYYNNFYWGVPGVTNTAWYNNPYYHNDNYATPVINAPSLPRSSYTAQSVDVPYTRTENSKNHGKIIYAKPVSKNKTRGAVKTDYKAKTSYNYTTKKRTKQQTGYYRPPSAPIDYGYPSRGGAGNGAGTAHNSSGSSRSNYQPNRPSSGAGYRPPSGGGYKPPSGSGGGSRPSAGSGSSIPAATRSSAGSAPRR